MNRAFTLIEIIVVIIIVGILAAVGITQYSKTVEKGRGAEARTALGNMRRLAYEYYLTNGTITGMTADDFNIGTALGQFPSACVGTHYFSYGIQSWSLSFIATATRCTSNGKSPQGSAANTLTLTTYLTAGAWAMDTWGGTGGY